MRPASRGISYRVRNSTGLIRSWWQHLPLSRRVAGFLALIIVAGLVRSEIRTTNALHQARGASSEVRQLLRDQTANRVKNVGVWCSAINGLEGVLVAYVNRVPAAPPLALPPLNCTRLEAGTAASTKKPGK